eukprot:145510-Rhodomonas_salina.1
MCGAGLDFIQGGAREVAVWTERTPKEMGPAGIEIFGGGALSGGVTRGRQGEAERKREIGKERRWEMRVRERQHPPREGERTRERERGKGRERGLTERGALGQCKSAPGCGQWKPPTIRNPAYKGKWYPPKVPNP